MNKTAQLFMDIGEPFATGFFEKPEASIAVKFCRAHRRFYEECPMNYVEDAPLFPSGEIDTGDIAVTPQYCMQMGVDWGRLWEKSKEAAEILGKVPWWSGVWVHSALNYRRILAEGVNKYEQRVRNAKDEDFRDALLDVLEGIRIYHGRALEYLRSINAEERLIVALERVPFEPVRTAYEAIVCYNFMFYLDGCDNIGRIDDILLPYWKGEDLTNEMRCMMQNLLDNIGWSVTLGPDYNDLTKQWLNAPNTPARPLVQLRVTDDMPDEMWELALEKVLSGCGQPSFYNEKAIQSRLAERLPDAAKEDIYEFGGVGCTETCFLGMTYSGGIDINLNVLEVFEKHMKENLSEAGSFPEFYSGFCKKLHEAQDGIINELSHMYSERDKWVFAPIRTLFIDDCIDKEKGYYQGGARFTFAVPSESGMPNTVDSLLAIRELVFDRKLYTGEEFLVALEQQESVLKARLAECPCYGVGDANADAIMTDLSSRFYEYYSQHKLKRGYDIFPTSHQFVRHIEEGEKLGPTPDGRAGGQAVADSIAAVNGKAIKGPTMMLLSASRFVQEKIYGMAVLNLSINRKFDAKVLRALIQGYFDMGGTQVQITCTTKETLLEARENPDTHRDLIVRVGGYSDYFRNLSDELKDAVIARTMFES